MPLKDSTPTEQMPQEYDGEIMTRAVEDIYQRLHTVSREGGSGLADALAAMKGLQNKVDGMEEAANRGDPGEAAVPPPPEDLDCYKIPFLPICVAWCKPIDVLKYRNVGGFQFFASLVKNFVPQTESSLVTFSGTAYSTHATNLVVCATASSKLYKQGADINLQFFASMSAGNSKTVRNMTEDTEGLSVSWAAATPKTLVTNIAWNDGDTYEFDTWMPRNLVGQGPLPFAVFFIADWIGNPGWDKETVYVKARTYTRQRKSYSFFQTASTTGNDGETLPAPTVSAKPIFWNGNIRVSWTRGTTVKDYFDELEHYDLYRTTANLTAQLTEGNVVYSGSRFSYIDVGYDVTNSPDGPVQGKTYWYWCVCVNKEGDNGTFSSPDAATLDVGGAVTIYDGVEDETTSFFNIKGWVIKWYDDGDSEGYWVRVRRDFGGASYGFWTLPVYVRHTTEYGQEAGYDAQQHVFRGLQVGMDYQFAVQATNNAFVPALAGSWVTRDDTITDSAPPDPPT